MKERPLLYTAPMVRATLNDTKTQTRRLRGLDRINASPNDWSHPRFIVDDHNLYARFINKDGDVVDVKCPYGKPGDQLWVRETWDFLPDGGPDEPNVAMIRYWAGGEMERRVVPPDFNPNIYSYEKKRPSIHMPRWASRIQLEITNIRVERLQNCSPADAVAEGILPNWCGDLAGFDGDEHGWLPFELRPGEENIPGVDIYEQLTPQRAYQVLWESINGPGSWDANSWVWVVEFRRIKP